MQQNEGKWISVNVETKTGSGGYDLTIKVTGAPFNYYPAMVDILEKGLEQTQLHKFYLAAAEDIADLLRKEVINTPLIGKYAMSFQSSQSRGQIKQ